ncbi:enoyl-CoA hydratase/isomerase family protein [Microbacterium sp. YY-01]|uniref:enoyl-CoA hydratase/isomerase family protein n=1 Tax=Microbacterium sp. YY-01 TaxID=3421634 RepID=UPI003D178750
MTIDVPTSSELLLAHRENSLGCITLNRPRALNALNLEMIEAFAEVLEQWRTDTDVHMVLLEGAGERGLCAGGDIRVLHENITSGDVSLAQEFFRTEYALNAAIAEFPKPFVALLDGITMGGGIGVGGHAAIRVVTERSQLAMPETRIGFTPDVGGTWLLAHAPGRVGEYLALTSASMSAADAIYAGFADYFVPSDRLDGLREALAYRADPAGPSELVLRFDETPDAAPLAEEQQWIDEVFSADTVAEIRDRLRDIDRDAARAALTAIEEVSPTSLVVALDAVREARAMPDLRAALAGEYRRVLWFAEQHPDLVEGIRAQVIDKDRAPRWQPATIDDLTNDAGAAARDFRPAVGLWDSND